MSLHIAIIGAGIGGLALAALASDAGHGVTLIERFERPHPVGSGLVIQPLGLAVLARAGAAEAAVAQGRPIRRMVGHEAAAGRRILSVSYRDKAPGLAIHRAALFQSLWDAVQARGLRVETGATITGAPEVPGGRMVAAADGRRFGPFDLVVDASGASSRLSP
ncbi:MAG: FAD-dependent oxidoreductase, partial [Albidovulum sp.]